MTTHDTLRQIIRPLLLRVDLATGSITPLSGPSEKHLAAFDIPAGPDLMAAVFGLDDQVIGERASNHEPPPFEPRSERPQWEFTREQGSDSVLAFACEWNALQALIDNLRRESLLFKELVLNILPQPIAETLIEKKAVRPKAYRNCTVLFTDVVSFSKLAFHLDPVSLIRKLNEHFSIYDQVSLDYGIEKIKTIGDAYMAASGIPQKKKSHAVDCVLAAMEMTQRILANRSEPHLVGELDLDNWDTRIGIHSGPCISGVVGSQKFVFDIWGDTVNVAARTESASEPNRINITADTHEEVKDLFECSHRGSLHVKNIGEVEMYFIEHIKPALSEDGVTPNAAFFEAYCKRFRISEKTRASTLELLPNVVQAYVAS